MPVEKLLPFKSQARKHFDQESIDALAGTIKEHGIRQPLTVLPSEDKEGYLMWQQFAGQLFKRLFVVIQAIHIRQVINNHSPNVF